MPNNSFLHKNKNYDKIIGIIVTFSNFEQNENLVVNIQKNAIIYLTYITLGQIFSWNLSYTILKIIIKGILFMLQ